MEALRTQRSRLLLPLVLLVLVAGSVTARSRMTCLKSGRVVAAWGLNNERCGMPADTEGPAIGVQCCVYDHALMAADVFLPGAPVEVGQLPIASTSFLEEPVRVPLVLGRRAWIERPPPDGLALRLATLATFRI